MSEAAPDHMEKQYVIGAVRSADTLSGKVRPHEVLAEFTARTVFPVADVQNVGIRAIEIATDEITASEIESVLPIGLAIEPVIEHLALVGNPYSATKEPTPGSGTLKITLRNISSSRLGGISVLVWFHNPQDPHTTYRLNVETNAEGLATFDFDPAYIPYHAVASPDSTYWPQVINGLPGSESIEVILEEIPMDGPYNWWHDVTASRQLIGGSGIRIGVLDTGVASHPDLRHVENIGAFHNGSVDPSNLVISGSHGTHVTGLIASRPKNGGYSGFAPDSDIYVGNVFPSESGASQADLANGINYLSLHCKVDLINLSLGSSLPSTILESAILDAYDAGILTLCAAGNSGQDVEYPARYAACVAIGAFGLNGTCPTASYSYSCRGIIGSGDYGDYFLSNFSAMGVGLTCLAPGVGIISTVPTDLLSGDAAYGVMDGTSMASPIVTGLLASVLATDSDYRSMDREYDRAEHARARLMGLLKKMGFGAKYEGGGRVCYF